MAALGDKVGTLVDLAKRMDPDGKIADIAELLSQENGVLEDALFKEGNLPTGERTTVRTSLPQVAARAINESIVRSKSTTAQNDEGAAMIESVSEVDRKLAILSGNVGEYRLSEAMAFYEAMNQTHARMTMYGNAAISPKEYNGIMTRYNAIAGSPLAQQIIDCGGVGSDNMSIVAVVWHPTAVCGIYPKGSKAGIQHNDLSKSTGMGDDGHPLGDKIYQPDGSFYIGYSDHFELNTGLSIKDTRCVVRAANISRAALRNDLATGADLEDILIQIDERLEGKGRAGAKVAYYMPRTIRAMLRRQANKSKRSFLGWDEIGGKMVLNFDGDPLRRVDAMNINEARVV